MSFGGEGYIGIWMALHLYWAVVVVSSLIALVLTIWKRRAIVWTPVVMLLLLWVAWEMPFTALGFLGAWLYVAWPRNVVRDAAGVTRFEALPASRALRWLGLALGLTLIVSLCAIWIFSAWLGQIGLG